MSVVRRCIIIFVSAMAFALSNTAVTRAAPVENPATAGTNQKRLSSNDIQIAKLDFGSMKIHRDLPIMFPALPDTRANGPFQVPYELTQRPELGTPADPSAYPHVSDPLEARVNALNRKVFRKHGLSRETGCLALAIYYEARGESRLGQIAVSQVVLNRVKSRKYPDSICEVVYQNFERHNRCQFSFTCDGHAEIPRETIAWARSVDLARKINCGTTCSYAAHETPPLTLLSDAMRRATHYHATYVSPRWASKLHRSGRIGQHIFYISARVWS